MLGTSVLSLVCWTWHTERVPKEQNFWDSTVQDLTSWQWRATSMLGRLFKRAASCLYSLTWAPTTRDTNTLVRVLSSDFVQQSPSWLQTGDQLWVLDQHGYSPRQWSKTGVVDEADGFDSYLVSYLRRNILAILLMKKAAKRASRQQLKRELTNSTANVRTLWRYQRTQWWRAWEIREHLSSYLRLKWSRPYSSMQNLLILFLTRK